MSSVPSQPNSTAPTNGTSQPATVETYYCLLQQGCDDDILEVEVTDEETKVGDVESDECKVKLSL